MKNAAERREYLENEDNRTPVEVLRNVRVSEIKYKGEKRFRLEVFSVVSRFDYHDRKQYPSGEWVVLRYYKTPDNPDAIRVNPKYNREDLLEAQIITELREWLADLDRKGDAE